MFLASCFPHAVDKLVVWGSTSYITEEDIRRLFESIRDISKWGKRWCELLGNVYGNELSCLWSEFIDSMIDVHDNI